MEGSLHVHTGSIASVLSPGSGSGEAADRGGPPVRHRQLDPNCRPAISPDAAEARDRAEDFVAASDVVKASDDDLRWLYPDRTPDESIGSLAGARHCHWWH